MSKESGPVAKWSSGRVEDTPSPLPSPGGRGGGRAEESGRVVEWSSGQGTQEDAVNRGANIDSNSNSNSNSNSKFEIRNPKFNWPGQSAQVWSQVQALAAQKAPLVWVSHLQLVKADAQTVWLGPGDGPRDLMKFITAQKNAREQLAGFFQQVLGHPLRIEWLPSAPAGSGRVSTMPVGSTPPSTTGVTSAANMHPQPVSAGVPRGVIPSAGSSLSDRQAAMRLPLVKQVMDLFDATIVEVRPENSIEAASATDTENDSSGAGAHDAQASRTGATDSTTGGAAAGGLLAGGLITGGLMDGHGSEDSPFTEEDENV